MGQSNSAQPLNVCEIENRAKDFAFTLSLFKRILIPQK